MPLTTHRIKLVSLILRVSHKQVRTADRSTSACGIKYFLMTRFIYVLLHSVLNYFFSIQFWGVLGLPFPFAGGHGPDHSLFLKCIYKKSIQSFKLAMLYRVWTCLPLTYDLRFPPLKSKYHIRDKNTLTEYYERPRTSKIWD